MERRVKLMSMNKWRIIVLAAFTMVAFTSSAQDAASKDEKQISKCWKVFHKKGYHKGIEKLEKYMAKQDWPSLLAYESLVAMEYEKYLSGSSLFSIEVTTDDGDQERSDSLTNVFQDLMVKIYRGHFIDVCRRSTIESTSPTADMYLRQLLIDVDPDTNVSEKGQSYYDEAEEFFVKEDFELADLNYRKAIKEDTGFYKAYLYLGDSFWAREQYDSALVYYGVARDMQPNLLEPRIYIIDALVEQGLYYRAKKECMDALLVYPGYNLKFKLQRILYVENKYLNERRLVRTFYPNEMGNDDQISMEHDPVWVDYRRAKEDVSKYCNEEGIIEENGEISDRYLEVYSVRRMLEKHPNDLPESLHFADKMREEGFLEPYVFISLFHIDIYPQFEHYMSVEENRTKTLDFVEKYLIEPINF